MSHVGPLLAVDTASLSSISSRDVRVPGYDRAALRPRIVHIGVGGFHRSHLALYTDELAADGSDWGIRGVGLLPGDAAIADALTAQDCLYTLVERSTGRERVAVIGSIVEMIHAHPDIDRFVAAVADPQTAIVSLTVTEAGYGEPAPGTRSTFDALAIALDARRRAGHGPITILSCDNLPGNGDAAARATRNAAARHSAELADWLAGCSFPNSMVDRITPVTSPADRAALERDYGVCDRWPVVAETFRQWVLEDDFAAGRPAWENVGALFTDDVHSWELYKLRFLNAGHSSIAYLSALAGVVFVDEAMHDPVISTFLTRLLHDEALPTLTEIPGYPREGYIATVLERFANTAVRDQIARLCIDGSAKFPTFLIPTIVRQLADHGPIERSALALAAWARYLAVTPLDQQAFDTFGDQARAFAAGFLAEPESFLDYSTVFPDAIRSSERFRAAFRSAAERLEASGPRSAMMELQSP